MAAQLRLVIGNGPAPRNASSVEYRARVFYDAYPLHVGWGHVIGAYRRAERIALADLRAAGQRSATEDDAHQAIMDGLGRAVFGTYVKHPTTWLNGRHWQDEPPRGATPTPIRTTSTMERETAAWVASWRKEEAAGWCAHSGSDAPCSCPNRRERQLARLRKFSEDAWRAVTADR